MAKSNSKNIRVFQDWFGIDNKSKALELETCEKLYSTLTDNKWEWSSDKSGFWVEEGGLYYRHRFSNGKYFNYPVPSEKDFKINGNEIIKIDKIHIGRVQGSESKRQSDEQIDPYYTKLAREDVSANPTNEEQVDWEFLKQQIDGEVL